MPRVSDEHLVARRRQIMAAARACFLRNGFHQTSMQDVIAEAGLSVGAVYRYFASKNELINAIASASIGTLDELFAEFAEQDPPPRPLDALERVLELAERQTAADGVFRLAMQVWAESLRNPELSRDVAEQYGGVRRNFVALAARAKSTGELPDDADPDAVGAVLFSLVPGYALQRVLLGGPPVSTYLDGLRTLLR